MKKIFLVLFLLFCKNVYAQDPKLLSSFDIRAGRLTTDGFNIANRSLSAHIFTWSLQQGVMTSCTIAFQTSPNNITWTTQATGDCLSGGTSSYLTFAANFIRISATTFTTQSGTPLITINYAGYIIAPTSIATITTAPLNNQNINNIRYALNFSGADAGVKMTACINDLPSTGGFCDATGFEGSQAITTTVDINKARTWLLLGSATYTISGSGKILVSKERSGIIGSGQQSSIIKFTPSATGTAIKVQSAGTLSQAILRGFSLDATGETTQIKTGIELNDVEEVEVSDVAISNWSTTTGKTSIGIRLQGRQSTTLSRLTLSANTPIRISKNVTMGQPDADHYHFQDLYLLADSNPNILVDDGVNLSNLTLDGYQAWVGGTDGFKYVSTTDTVAALSIHISNARWEQGTGSTGRGVSLSNAQGFYGVTLTNIYTSNAKGFLLKGIVGGIMSGCTYASANEALNTSGDMRMAFIGNYFNLVGGATLSTTGLANSVWIGNDSVSKVALGSSNPTNQLVVPNNTSIASVNGAGSAEIAIVKVNASNQLNFATGGQVSYYGGQLIVGSLTLPTSHQLVIPNSTFFGGENSGNTDSIPLIGSNGSNQVYIDPGAGGIKLGNSIIGAGGGAAPTFTTIGGSGPTTAAQNGWLKLFDNSGAAFWIPVWK